MSGRQILVTAVGFVILFFVALALLAAMGAIHIGPCPCL